MENNLVLIPSIHEKYHMVLKDGYLYEFNRKYERKLDNQIVFYWICQKKCGVRLQTIVVDNMHIQDLRKKVLKTEHSHVPDSINIKIKSILQGIKRRAEDTNDKPTSIYQDAIVNVPIEIGSQLSKKAVMSTIKRKRKVTTYNEPQSLFKRRVS